MGILFPFGIRLSTLLAVAAFLALAALRRDRAPLLAGWVWICGFEAVFQATSLTLGHPLPTGRAGPVFFVILGAITVPWFTRHGARPSLPLVALFAVIWTVWVVIGFPVNQHTMTGFDPLAEALNEAAKTTLGLAYLLPLRARSSRLVLAEASS